MPRHQQSHNGRLTTGSTYNRSPVSMAYPPDPTGRRPSETTMLQYAGPQERASSLSNADPYRIEAANRPSLTWFAPQSEDHQEFSTATSHVSYGPYAAPDNLIVMSQRSYGQFEARPASAAPLPATYGGLELPSSSTGAPYISYSPNEAVHSPLHPSAVSGGGIDRPADNRRQRTQRARPSPVYTQLWYCCICKLGPYDPSLYADCVLGCHHKRCVECPEEYIQVYDYEAPRTSPPAMFREGRGRHGG